ncbi:MAG: hypothetical protein V1824_01320 [archaeon]
MFIYNSVFAACSISANYNGTNQNLQLTEETNSTIEFSFGTSNLITTNLNFTASNCNDLNKSKIVKLISTLNFQLSEDVTISGNIDKLKIDNSFGNIDIIATSENVNGFVSVNNKKLKILIQEVIIEGNGITNIKLVDSPESFYNAYHTVELPEILFQFKKIIIGAASTLNLEIKTANGYSPKGSATKDGYSGGDIEIVGEEINSEGRLNLNLISGNGGKGTSGGNHKSDDGGNGGYSGQVKISVFKLSNYNLAEIKLKSGSSGNGGNGSNEGKGPRCEGSPRSAGNGGISGDIIFNINEIYNKSQDSSILIDLNSGSSGNGGNGGKNHCSGDESANGGSGGKSGDIIFQTTVSKIYNYGNLIINGKAGSGGNGGKKEHGGSYGKGGSGGNISNLNFSNIANYNNLEINLLSGKMGKGKRVSGKAGTSGDITINYLDNRKISQDSQVIPAIKIITQVNQDEEEISSALSCEELGDNLPTSGSIFINSVKSGSLLPLELKSINNNPIDVSQINISGCNFSEDNLGENNLEYFANQLYVKAVNYSRVERAIKRDNLYSILVESNQCPYCETISFDNLNYRINDEYSIYSKENGIINSGDLKIYYALDNTPNQKYNLTNSAGISDMPIFVNIKPITGIKVNSLSADNFSVYKYTITKDSLYAFEKPVVDERFELGENFNPSNIAAVENISSNLGQADNLYCYGQQYYIDGKINSDSSKQFAFPFLPLYDFR